MKRSFIAIALVVGGGLPALAHHSFDAEYDANKVTNISGFVTKVDWQNPHAFVYIDAADQGGAVKSFRVEMGPPYALALQQFRNSKNDLYPPLVRCKPAGGNGFFNAPGFEIVEVPEEKKVYILDIAGPHSWRVIYMDGRPHPSADALRPTYLGHSIGRWDGDTLVIDTIGFNEKQWVAGSYPTTDQLHMTERISRPNLKTLSYEMTIDDPGVYTRPWSGRWTITETTPSKWIAGGEMFEYICQDSR